jgi:hypothetical protein
MNEWNGGAAAILLAFGIVVPLPAFGGGMLLALGCCYAVRAFRPVDGRKSLGLSLFVAILAAMLVAGLRANTSGIWVWGGLPLQIQMAAAGMLSQFIFELIAARGSGALGKLADRVGIGGGEK